MTIILYMKPSDPIFHGLVLPKDASPIESLCDQISTVKNQYERRVIDAFMNFGKQFAILTHQIRFNL